MVTTTTGLATSYINFSRASLATVTNNVGNIAWAGHNLLTNSESFDASAWVKSFLSVTANSTTAPNGTTTADKLYPTSSSGRLYQNITAPEYSILAFYAKAAEMTALNVRDPTNNSLAIVYVDLITGAISGSSAANASAVSVGEGWWLITWSTAGVAYTNVSIAPCNAVGSTASTPSGTNGIYLWGAHLYRSDLGGMVYNPAQPAGFGTYYPTTPKNLLGYTEDFSAAAWGLNATAITRTANATSAPNGLQTGNSITGDGSSAIHYFGNNITLSSSTTYTLSFYAKSNGVNIVQAFIGGGTGYANFDLVNGIAGTNASPFGVPSMVAAGNGWFRCSVPIVTPSFSQVYFCLSNSASATRAPSFATSNGIYIWGAQLSDSASIDPYTPVYGAAVTSAAYYAPRLDYSPTTIQPLGLLVEEQRVNLFQHSAAFDNAAWAKGGGVTVTADATTAPDGTSTADRVVSANATAQMYVGEQTIAVTSGVTYSQSVFAKAGEYNLVQLRFSNAAFSNAEYATFNLATGTIVQSSGSGHSIAAVGNGWYRCTAVAVATSTTNAFPAINLATSASGGRNPSITGDGTSGLFLWGAQLEAGSFATSYIPTSASQVTRSADIASVSTQAFPYSSSASSLVLAATLLGTSGGNRLLELSASALANGLLIYQSAGLLRLSAYVDASGVTLGDVTVGAVQKIGIAYDGLSNGTVLNGGTVSSVGTTVSAAANKLSIGTGFNNGSVMNGHIRQITYLPRRLTNAELQTRTT